jgi:hypothetical protein
MEQDDKFKTAEAPEWAGKISNEQLLVLSVPNDRAKAVKEAGKGLCYFYKEVLNTTNQQNQDYILRSWHLNNADNLQGASIMEFLINENQHIIMHRLLLIRDGQLIDKTKDLNVRVFNDEKSSSFGTINKTNKVNCVVSDLRLNDIFIQEYSHVTVFKEDNFLDKKFFRSILSSPKEYWFYMKYSYKLIQNRDEKVNVRKKYFRDAEGQKLPEANNLLEKGQSFEFNEENFQYFSKEDMYAPYFEMATDATWEQIAAYIYSFYKNVPAGQNLKTLEPYKALKLSGESANLENDIQAVIEYVQNQIVYLYDAEVMHGHIPDPSEKTITLKSGDCKAKSQLLIDLLASLGVSAEFILVNFSFDYFIPEYMPSPFVFNHEIVKVSYNGKDYFVDPTKQDCYGILGKRAEPMFSSFLPVKENSDLVVKKQEVGAGVNVEKNINLSLSGDTGLLKVEAIFRRESADIIRKNFKNLDIKESIKQENRQVFNALSYPKEKEFQNFFSDTELKIVSDDKRENCLKTFYQSKLVNPYHTSKKAKIIKYYYSAAFDNIKKHKHKDHLCDSFCFYPLKYQLKIESDLFVDKNEAIVKRNTKIENDYFSFYNTKKILPNSVEVSSGFLPKNYEFIKSGDLENIKKDVIKIENSNYGVGVVFVTYWQNASRKWYFLLVVYVLIFFIVWLVMVTTNSQFNF